MIKLLPNQRKISHLFEINTSIDDSKKMKMTTNKSILFRNFNFMIHQKQHIEISFIFKTYSENQICNKQQ